MFKLKLSHRNPIHGNLGKTILLIQSQLIGKKNPTDWNPTKYYEIPTIQKGPDKIFFDPKEKQTRNNSHSQFIENFAL